MNGKAIALGILLSGMVAQAETITSIIETEAIKQGFEPSVAVAIATIESGLNPRAVGSKGEIGLMQILPGTSRLPRALLFDPKTNARIGILRLKEMKRLCPMKDGMDYIICYNNGLRHPKHPALHPYYRKFMTAWNLK